MKTSNDLLLMRLQIDLTDEELLSGMRAMKAARENPNVKHILCMIEGYDDDLRELYEVPEVREFCKRLERLGYISYLDLLGGMSPVATNPKFGWGIGEICLAADNRLKREFEFNRKELLAELKERMLAANVIADATIGKPNP